jgi:hypothetical protein
MGIFDALRRIRGRSGQAGRPAVPTEHGHEHRRVDTALVIEAARHVVTTRIATRTSLARHLYIAPETAAQLLAKLEHCEVIAPARPGQAHRVLATSGELPGLIEEFRRRG